MKFNINILYIIAPLFALFIVSVMIVLSLTTEQGHCINCPSVECLCIQDVNGNWMLSPEVGE